MESDSLNCNHMLVKEIMTKPVVTIEKDKTVYDACIIYRDRKIGCIVVVDDKKRVIGIITERDLIERTICNKKNPEKTKIEEIMSSDIKTIHALDTINNAIEVMQRYNLKKLPVIQNDVIVGIITATDIARARPDISERFVKTWVRPEWQD